MSKSPSEEGLFFFVMFVFFPYRHIRLFFLTVMLGFNPGISF
jgi:hypothetical protein